MLRIYVKSPPAPVEIVPDYYPVNYGLLYNWYAANDVRKITSSDAYFVPEIEDWVDLLLYFGGTDYRPDFPAADLFENTLQLLSLTTWGKYAGTNITGFNLKGGGFRNNLGFLEKDFSGLYIARDSFAINATSPFGVGLSALPEAYLSIYTSIEGMAYSKTYANSLKCFRWATEAELLLPDGLISEKYTGNNGNKYDLTKIDNRIWLADNLAETKYRNGDWIKGFDGGVYTPISNATWAAATTAMCCVYDDDLTNM